MRLVQGWFTWTSLCSDPLTLWYKLSLYNQSVTATPIEKVLLEKINSSLFPIFLSSWSRFSINRLFPGWLSRSGWVVGTSEALPVPGPPVVPIRWIWLRWAVFSFNFECWFVILLTTVGSLFRMFLCSFALICLVWYRSLDLSQSPQMSCFDEMITGTLFLVFLMHGTLFCSISCMAQFHQLFAPPLQVQLQTKKDGNIGALAQAKIIIRFRKNKDLVITLKQIQYLNLKGLRVSLPSTTGCQRR